MYSEEHRIALPIVDPSLDTPQLPLVFNVIALYWGEDLTQASGEMKPQYKGVRGSVLIEAIEAAEKSRLRSVMYKSGMKDIKRKIDQGIPIITILPGIHDVVQHATIVSGYSSQERRILIYVPDQEKHGAIPEKKFEEEWEEDDTTSIILIPTDMQEIIADTDFKFQDSNRRCLAAERLRLHGNTTTAIEELSHAVDIDDDNPLAWYSLGSAYSEQQSDSAIQCYERAIHLNNRYYLAYRALGNYYLKKEQYDAADSWYTRAIDINPVRFGPIYKNRAFARSKIGKGSVKEDLEKYLRYTPDAVDRNSIQQTMREL